MADDFSGLSDAVGAIVKSNAQDTATQIRNNAQNSVGANPDQEAEYTHLARFTGAPIDTVRAQPGTIKKQAAAQQIDADAIAQDHPVTGQFLTDPNKMKLALDDIANMRDLESTSRGPGYLSSLWQKFGASGLRTYLGGKAMIGDIMGDQEMTRQALSDIHGTDEYEKTITPAFDTTLGRWSYNAISGLINTVPALAAGIGTGGLGTLGVFGAQGLTEGYGKYRARGGTPGEAALGGGLEGGINIATSFLPVKYLSNAFGKVGAGQFITGLLARDLPMMEAQTLANSIVDTAIANPNKSWGDFAKELPEQTGQAATSALFFGGFFGAAHAAIGRLGATQMKVDAAIKDGQVIDGLNNLATASKVRARDTETFKGFMDEATKDGPVENLYIDPRALQQAGVDVDALAQAVPSIKDSVEVAKASGSDIKIPTSDFATTLAGTDVGNALLQHLKTDPNGMSKAEADEFVATQGEQLKAEIEKALAPKSQDNAFNASRQNVFNDVMTKLGETGRFTKDVNEQYALLHSTFASYMGARLGMTPEEFYQKYHGSIVAESLADASPERAFYQQAGKSIDDILKVASQPGNENKVAVLGSVSPWLTERAKEAGLDIDGFQHALDTSAVRHVRKNHGSEKIEAKRGQVAVTDDDLRRLPELLANPDKVVFGAKTKIGRDAIGYIKTMPDGSTLYLEEVRTGRNQLAAVSMRKYPATTNATSLLKSLRPTSETLREDGLIIHEVPENARTIDVDKAFQQGSARGAYDPVTRTIAMLKAADLSTFLHESGHFFLDTLNRIAADPSMPQEVKGDMNTALQWFGVEGATPEERLAKWNAMSPEEQRPFHEQWARGFEKYLFEGKAPSLPLREAFQRFRSWLLNVYRGMLQAVGGDPFKSNISPEVRSVFDRMLASADEIKDAEAMRNLEPLFKDAKTAGMTDEQFKAYQQEGLQATQDAMEYLQNKSLKDMQWLSNARSRELSRLQRDAEAKRKSVRAEVTDEVMNEPVNKARTFFKRGEFNGEKVEGAHRLDIDGVKRVAKDMYGDGVDAPIGELESKFGKYGVLGKDGIDPETAAEMFGFNSAQDLVHALLNAENPRDKIAGLTDQRMLERYGNISDPIALQKTADEAVFNDARAKFLATEASALSKAVGKKSILMSAARDVAGQMIDRLKIRNLRPDQYANASAKAARNAEAARGKDDLATAAIEKRNQLIQSLAYKSANKAQEDILKGLNYLKKFEREGTRKALSGDYMSQIDALLDRFDLRSGQSLKAIDRRASLKQWVEAQREKGYEPAIDDRLLDEAQKVHYKDMSVEAFRGLIDAVKSIEHLGRLKQRLRDGQEMREFNAIVNEAVTNIGKLPQVDQPDVRNPGVGGRGLDKINAKWLNVKSTLRSADASLLKMEQICDWLDSHDPNGTMNRIVFRRLADAEAKESSMLRSMKADVSAVFEAMPEESRSDLLTRYELPELSDNKTGKPSRMLKSEILSMALNCANESNYGKMLEGEGWTDRGVRAVLDRTLKPGDVAFVNNMVATIEKLWPEIAALEERVSGVAPPKIEGRPFETKAGTIKGGYFPVVYDPLRSHNADKNAEKSGDKLFENSYIRATTDKGHTIAREDNFSDSVYLSLNVIPRHLTQAIHDIAYREAVIDADRFLQDKRVRGAIEETLGREYYKQFRPWLQAIANDKVYDNRGLAFWDKAAHAARTNATIVGLGYRLSTMMIHGATAASNSIGEVGGRWMMSGVKSFFGTPEKMASTRDFVYERSEMMRNRMRDMDRDIRDAFREMEMRSQTGALSAVEKGKNTVTRFAYYGISMLDMASAMPTWVGAYNKALAPEAKGGLNMSEAEAIYYADKAVRNAHGGGGTKDLASIQRGSETQKLLLTMFYSFWNHFYNRQRDIVRRAAALPETYATDKAQAAKDFGMVLSRSFFYFIAPQLIHAALKPAPQGSSDDENMVLWAAEEIGLGLMSGIPVLRDIGNSMFTGRDYTATPAAQIITNAAKSFSDANHWLKGEDVSDKWLKHAIENSGYVFGLPTGQASSTVQFLWDVAEGDQSPSDLSDWWSGVVYGKMKP
jgi:hypothetical protein